jgi:hypothetical protein
MTANSFTVKQLRATLILGGSNQVFPGTNSNRLTITGLRMSAQVLQVARLAATLSLKIWGMKQDFMNALTVAWAIPPVILDNVVIVEAKDNADPDPEQGWTQLFSGTITEAQPEYRAQPNVYFSLQASCGYFQKIEPTAPTSYTETVDIGFVGLDLATRMGFGFDISPDVSTVLGGPLYLHGTLYEQLAAACVMAKADFYVFNDKILITKAGKPRTVEPAVVLTPSSGMIGYPVFGRDGLTVQAIYQPAFSCGVPIEIKDSIVPHVNGRWFPRAMTIQLDSNLPGGKWDTTMMCNQVLA